MEPVESAHPPGATRDGWEEIALARLRDVERGRVNLLDGETEHAALLRELPTLPA